MPDQAGVVEAKTKRERSPSFPFIPLAKAIQHCREFATMYKRNEVRVGTASIAWDFKEMSSQTLRTVAALKAFGLLEDTGVGMDRKVRLTDLAWRILEDDRPGRREEAIREAALRPAAIATHWDLWGAQRPPDAACMSQLKLDEGFTPEAAQTFLIVYDETIGLAKLAESDKLTTVSHDEMATPNDEKSGQKDASLLTNLPDDEGTLMEGERVIYTQESGPNDRLRLIMSGDLDEDLIEGLEFFLKLKKKQLQREKEAAKEPIS
jgi:hypothetical protein